MARRKKKNKIEFSKIILAGVMVTYFLTTLAGIFIILMIDSSQIGVLCTFVGTQTTTALAFYSWKAKNENVEKIKTLNTVNTVDNKEEL